MPALYVNKELVNISSVVPGDTPLRWILRDSLNLTGTKYGCGMALCGACTVYVDGQPVRSCTTPLARQATSEAAASPCMSPSIRSSRRWPIRTLPLKLG